MTESLPAPGSPEELAAFARLQAGLGEQIARLYGDRRLPAVVVVVPSLSLDPAELSKITGAHHYEERMLFMLMLLRLPRTEVVFVTSQPIPHTIVDYYLHLLSGVPHDHARRRLHLLACHDGTSRPLTEKILERPRLLARIAAHIQDPRSTHLACFNSTPLERTLAVRLGVPLYANDPGLAHLGTKSGSREIFRAAGVPLPDGFERLRDDHDIAQALLELRRRHPRLRRAVVKLDEGFSGEGNALFDFSEAPDGPELAGWIRERLPRLRFEAATETWEGYRQKFARMSGIVECFLEGEEVRSPSVQCLLDPLGNHSVVATHDQVLGGPSGQIYLGCTFPADEAYRLEVQAAGEKIGAELAARGALGRLGIDFLSVRREGAWIHHAIEINLRKGGTTHPLLTLEFLTDGTYDRSSGFYRGRGGQPKFYRASDNLLRDAYRGLTPDDLIDIAVDHRIHVDGASQTGVVFHLIGAISQFGKLGLVAIGNDPASADDLYHRTIRILDQETTAPPAG